MENKDDKKQKSNDPNDVLMEGLEAIEHSLKIKDDITNLYFEKMQRFLEKEKPILSLKDQKIFEKIQKLTDIMGKSVKGGFFSEKIIPIYSEDDMLMFKKQIQKLLNQL